MSDEYEGLTVADAIAKERSKDNDVVLDEVVVDEPVLPMDEVREELGIGEAVDPISALLDAPEEAPTSRVFIKRLNAWFDIEAITDDRAYDRIVDRCTKIVKNRRGGSRSRELDSRRLARLTVATYTVNPAFSPGRDVKGYEKLAARYGTNEPEDLVDRALLMGEIDLITDAIMSLSGFEDEVETAGN